MCQLWLLEDNQVANPSDTSLPSITSARSELSESSATLATFFFKPLPMGIILKLFTTEH